MKAAFGVGFLFQNKVNTLFAGWAYLCDAVIGVNAYRRTYERTDGRTDGRTDAHSSGNQNQVFSACGVISIRSFLEIRRITAKEETAVPTAA